MWRTGRRMFLLPLLLLLLWMNLSPLLPLLLSVFLSLGCPYGSVGWGQGHQSIPGKTHYHRYHLQKNKQDSGNQSVREREGKRKKVILSVFIICNYNYYKSYCLYPWRWWWTRPAHKQYDLFDLISSLHLTFRVYTHLQKCPDWYGWKEFARIKALYFLKILNPPE